MSKNNLIGDDKKNYSSYKETMTMIDHSKIRIPKLQKYDPQTFFQSNSFISKSYIDDDGEFKEDKEQNPFELLTTIAESNSRLDERIQALRYMFKLPIYNRETKIIEILQSIIANDSFDIDDRYSIFNLKDKDPVYFSFEILYNCHLFFFLHYKRYTDYCINSINFIIAHPEFDKQNNLQKVVMYLNSFMRNKRIGQNYRKKCAIGLCKLGFDVNHNRFQDSYSCTTCKNNNLSNNHQEILKIITKGDIVDEQDYNNFCTIILKDIELKNNETVRFIFDSKCKYLGYYTLKQIVLKVWNKITNKLTFLSLSYTNSDDCLITLLSMIGEIKKTDNTLIVRDRMRTKMIELYNHSLASLPSDQRKQIHENKNVFEEFINSYNPKNEIKKLFNIPEFDIIYKILFDEYSQF